MKGPRPAAAQTDFDEVMVEFAPRPRVRLVVIGVPVPKTRAECTGAGICLAFSCRHSTTVEATPRGGLRVSAPGLVGRQRSLRVTRRSDRSDPVGFERDAAFDGPVLDAIERIECNCALDYVEANPDGMTLEEIGVVLGRTEERIRQIEEKALRKLRRECDRLGIELADFLLAWRSGR